jgi:type I restriction-modification system DNA methylase subunit
MLTVDKENAKKKLTELVSRFEQVCSSGKEGTFSEADVSSKFILPLLDILGWNISDIDEVKEQRRTLSGPADYALAINRKSRLIVELKKFTEDLDGYRKVRGRRETFPEQATRYAWHLKVEWVVLTNFKEVRLYNSYYKKTADGLRLQIRYTHFYRDFDKLWTLSRQSVESGELDKIERKAERKNIDEAVLEGLLEIRRLLSESINLKNPSITLEGIRENVQRIMDRLIVVRVAEDRGLIGFESLHKELDSWKNRGLPTPFMRSLKSIFRDFDDIYNTKLFESHSCEDLSIDNDVLETIIDILYQYNFDLISADVLGAIYENYLGHVLEETTSGGVQITESSKARKKKGIYYTPTHLVEHVVRATLGELLTKCKSPEEVSRIKVLDPACGSGSFLIKAFDIIKEWYDKYNKRLTAKGGSLEAHFQTITDVNRKILTENLFGVDIDPQAAEIASVNLMLKALKRGEKLPQIMGQNIKVGNSLVNGMEEGFEELSDEAKQGLRPFKWDQEFPHVFAEDGFDVVIGNPPYYKVRRANPIRISPTFDAIKTGPVNAAMMFIDCAINLTKSERYVGLVLPKMLTYTKGWKGSREEVFNTKIRSVIDCQEAFEGVLLEQILLTLEKISVDESYTYRVGEAKGSSIIISAMHVPQDLAIQEDFIFLEPSDIAYKIRQKMLSGTVQLRTICDIILGQGIQSFTCWHEKPQAGDLTILRGDDVQMWHIRGGLYFSPDVPEMQRFKDRMLQLSVPHIVAQRIVAHIRYPKPHIILMAAYDTSEAFAFNTVVNILVTKTGYDYRYILGLLNSKLFSYYAYKFIYNNAVRSMDFYKDYAGRLPVKPLSMSRQKEIIKIVESITAHFKKPSRQAPEYRRYFTEMVVRHRRFNDYYRQLDPSERDPKDITTVGIMKNLCVVEDGEWLSFRVDYLDQSHHRAVTSYEVLRCRFQDRSIRTFLLNEINARSPSNRGRRLLDTVLMMKIPAFHRTRNQDEQLIRKQLEPYLKDCDAHQAWEKEYMALDEKLNRNVYAIYGLNEEEIKHVEENSRPTGWHAD